MGSITLSKQGIEINGEDTILVASSLFYFRIPREKWEERMKELRSAGYNAIDVYFPWNYHETSPQKWSFEKNKDVDAFLNLAKENDLWVIARPGPYICSEWDGGGIPAWLFLEGGGRIRQDDPVFLKNLTVWYEKIIPIIRKHQITCDGPVVFLQIENELDYFNCGHPETYITKLAKIVRGLGITVPLLCCCGQDDTSRSGAQANGVVPAFNIYANSKCAGLERRCISIYGKTQRKGFPFIITETNREHSFVKRLFACGAKMISPYNQTGGTNMDYYNGLSNWGHSHMPVSLIGTYYDFHSMVAPNGELSPEYIQARLFNSLRLSLGKALASARPTCVGPNIHVTAKNIRLARIETMHQKGAFLSYANLESRETTTKCMVRKKAFSVVSQSLATALLPMDLPIDDTTTLLFSNYEIACLQHKEDGTTIVLMYGYGQLQLWVNYKRTKKIYASQPLENGISHRRIGNCDFVFGKPEEMAYLELAGMPSPIRQKCNQARITDVLAGSLTAPPHIDQPGKLQELEKNDLFRGVGCYRFSLGKKQTVVVTSLSDFVTIFKDGKFIKFLYGTGGTYRFTLSGGVYDFVCEIWGHSNFDDMRVPSLRYGSLKGMGRTFVVKNEIDLTENWNFFSDAASKTSFLMNIDGYNRPLSPLSGVYSKHIALPTDDDSFILHFSQAECCIRVSLNGREVATVCKIDPYVDITDHITAKEITLTLSVTRRYFSDNVGKVTLMCGSRIKNCLFGDCTYRGEPPRQWKRTQLPLPLPVGENTIIKPLLKDQGEHDLEISFEGSDAILTIFCNEHTVGRIILDNHVLPVVAGGPAKNIFVCKEWLVAGGITIKCQALTKNAILNSIRTKEIISL